MYCPRIGISEFWGIQETSQFCGTFGCNSWPIYVAHCCHPGFFHLREPVRGEWILTLGSLRLIGAYYGYRFSKLLPGELTQSHVALRSHVQPGRRSTVLGHTLELLFLKFVQKRKFPNRRFCVNYCSSIKGCFIWFAREVLCTKVLMLEALLGWVCPCHVPGLYFALLCLPHAHHEGITIL